MTPSVGYYASAIKIKINVCFYIAQCRTAVESMQSSLERWNSTDGVETFHNNTYMETERRQKIMPSV